MPTRAIKAIFFTRFHHLRGSHVLHQVPSGSITPSNSPSALSQPLIDFSSCTTYLIPTQEFSDRLVTFCNSRHRVIGYPICIREGKYSRNEFIFNFAVVVEESVGDWQAYGEVVRKMGTLLRILEEQGGFLSREEDEWGVWGENSDGEDGHGEDGSQAGGGMYSMYGVDVGNGFGGESESEGEHGSKSANVRVSASNDGMPQEVWKTGGSRVHALCEMIMEDLNNYAECMIPIDETNTINLKLFPTHPPPPPVFLNQVPLLTISLQSLTAPISSDLTLMRIIPFINGINSVAHIAQLADTDLSLTRKALQHLIYYGCLVLLDVFSFGAIYAPTAEISGFVLERSLQEECARYVRVPKARLERRGTLMGGDGERHRDERASISSDATARSEMASPTTPSISESNQIRRETSKDVDLENPDITPETLITLYTRLRQGLTLRQWVLDNIDLLPNIDIRRFITFGIIKGFLYRVHKYAITTSTHHQHHQHLHSNPPPPAPPTSLQSHPHSSHATTPSHNSTASNSLAASHRDSDASTIRAHVSPSQLHTTLLAHHHHHHRPSTTGAATREPPQLPPQPPASEPPQQSDPLTRLDSIVSEAQAHAHAAAAVASTVAAARGSSENTATGGGSGGLPLMRFLDGMHAFDEICMELGLSEKVVERKIRGVGDVQVIYR
ncbi:NPR2-domain-containing protein [Aaosphaeria arxii CBS 175.79]|uniref:NPR2-domain-containing protein n=1 Tax=Aaosphaeria arxii CBS 175.79 TaxID=1450172 RepID=A0A6A5XXA8_9PLEO|nr:NPR2-domain-containing protein [Aaosphaeria arxii CBS 175.79]KAF2017543.1 NPR2-domain-containing protein [Aaosphaeria arxii CBS 175.79]